MYLIAGLGPPNLSIRLFSIVHTRLMLRLPADCMLFI